MEAQQIFEKLKEEFGDDIIEFTHEEPSDPFIEVKPDKIFDIGLFLRDEEELKFDYFMCLSGMDHGDKLGAVYHLHSIEHSHKIAIKTFVEKDNPKIPTLERVWRSADWHEREAYDLFGFIFEGHSNLIRILLPYDWEGYPLRKDYKEPETYHGIKVPY